MTNEEKILEILVKHGEMLEGINQRLDRVDERFQQTAVLLETEVDRKLSLLYEGHDAIMEHLDRLTPKDRVEALESDVALLKDVVKLMRQEISELKKAQ